MSIRAFWIPALIAACVAPVLLWADAPVLRGPEKILAAGKPVDVPVGHAVPWVVDWNRDGKKDLLVGQFRGGKIRIYLNSGTDAEPAFEGFSYVRAGEAEISLPAG
jgi:hypothetical protein